MLKKVSVSLIVLALASTVIAADLGIVGIEQQQTFGVGLEGVLGLFGATGGDMGPKAIPQIGIIAGHGGQGGNNPMFENDFHLNNLTYGELSGDWAKQKQDVDLNQNGDAKSNGGLVTVTAALGAGGAQEQAVGLYCAPIAQGQGATLTADQVVLGSKGTADQDGTIDQLQKAENATGYAKQDSHMHLVDQDARFAGLDCAEGTVATSATATTSQAQVLTPASIDPAVWGGLLGN